MGAITTGLVAELGGGRVQRRSGPVLRWSLRVSIIALFFSAHLGAEMVPVQQELVRLAREQHFRVDGIEHLEERDGRLAPGSVRERLAALLEGVDHIIIQAPGGEVERVLILGLTQPGDREPSAVSIQEPTMPSAPIRVATTRQGQQHLIATTLEGAHGTRIDAQLLIDTGADAVVLPASMIGRLGLSTARLKVRDIQTANGRTTAHYGDLPAIWLDQARLANVAVAFIQDERLGEHGLVGMSLLGRFRMTIDDQANELTLEPR